MHVRYPRAAVAASEAPSLSQKTGAQSAPQPIDHSASTQVLWAASALTVRGGRAIGLRRRGETVEVAMVRTGANRLQWVSVESVMTAHQVAVWLRNSRFAP